MSQTAAVRLNYELTEPSEVGRGVRQGCLISPTLFNVYAEAMMKEALDDFKEGICVGGELVQSVRYADDHAMTANTDTFMYLTYNYVTKHLKGHLSKHQKPNKHTCSKKNIEIVYLLSFSFGLLFQDRPNENSPTPLALQALLKKLFLHGMDDLLIP